MAARSRAAHFWLSRPGLHLAGAGPPAAVQRRCRSSQSGAVASARLRLGLGIESAQNSRTNPPLGRNLERTFRHLKKISVTILQVLVTVAVLWLVFHDPEKRRQMAHALATADYHWLVAATICYVLVESAAAARWHVLLQVQGIRLSIPRVSGLFLIGMFFNQFLPGGTGGDIVKSYYL